MECKTLANHPTYDSWSSSRYLHCSLFTPALCGQSMRRICFCRCFPFNQSRYTDSFDISLRIARFASYRKYRLSDSSLFNVSVSSACTNHPTPTHGDLCRNGKLQKAGFRNRPTQVFLFLTTVATLGTVLQIVGHHHLHLPESIVALTIAAILFLIFEWTGKYFAPSGALAFIPMLLPQEGLAWLPLEASIGAALFITIAMVVFQKCYKWNRAQLIFCATPTLLREYMNRKKREKQIE